MIVKTFSKNLLNTIKYSFSSKYSVDLKSLSANKRLQILTTMAPKHREDPIIMKLDNIIFKTLFSEELNDLSQIFKKYGYEIRIAGGAVRDLLMNHTPKDLDFATTATPDQMKQMFTTEKIRMINAKGEKHGTITPRINDKENYEVTTLRIDVVTDGRHAEVQYTTDWLLDANRRDLTINSMYLGLDGSVYDYFYGYDDLKEHRIAFVGLPETRIQEDYLRILRYFRFYGRIAKCEDNHEEDTLKAITDNGHGLQKISGERIWTELKKILEGNFAGELMTQILKCDLGSYIGLPSEPNMDEMQRVWSRCKTLKLNAITFLSSLLNTPEEAMQLNTRLKFSVYERELLLFLIEHRQPKPDPNPLRPYQRLLVKSRQKDTRSYIIEVLKYNNQPNIEEFASWEAPKFPVNGAMLRESGVDAGKVMGVILEKLRAIWADSEFKTSGEELMRELPRIAQELKDRRNK